MRTFSKETERLGFGRKNQDSAALTLGKGMSAWSACCQSSGAVPCAPPISKRTLEASVWPSRSHPLVPGRVRHSVSAWGTPGVVPSLSELH